MDTLPSEIINIIAKHFGYVHWCQMSRISRHIHHYLSFHKHQIIIPNSYKAIKELIICYDSNHIYEILQSRLDNWVLGDVLCCIGILKTKQIIAISKRFFSPAKLILRQRYGPSKLLQHFINYELAIKMDFHSKIYSMQRLFNRIIQWSVKRNNLQFIKIFNTNYPFQYILSIYAIKYGRFYLYMDINKTGIFVTQDLISFYAAKYEYEIGSEYFLHEVSALKGAIYYENYEVFLHLFNKISNCVEVIVEAVIYSEYGKINSQHINLTKNLLKNYKSIKICKRHQDDRLINKLKPIIKLLGLQIIGEGITYIVLDKNKPL